MLIKLVYVDDVMDTALSEYLEVFLQEDLSSQNSLSELGDVQIEYVEVQYIPSAGFYSLLKNEHIQRANIVLFDSMLFQTNTKVSEQISGEAFCALIKKYYPFIETLVITQQEERIVPALRMIRKYNRRSSVGTNEREYYRKELCPRISDAIELVLMYREQFQSLSNQLRDGVVLEKVANSKDGIPLYDEFSKEDIDALVHAMAELSQEIKNDLL